MTWILLFAALIVGGDGVGKLGAHHVTAAGLRVGWVETAFACVLLLSAVVVYVVREHAE